MEIKISAIRIFHQDVQAVSPPFQSLLINPPSATSALYEPGYRYEIKKHYKVTNPRELIHQYATTTPIQTIPGYEKDLADGGITRTIKQSYMSSTEER